LCLAGTKSAGFVVNAIPMS